MLNKLLFVILCGLVLSVSARPQSISATFSVDPVATKSTDRLVVTLTGKYTCGPLPQPQPPIGATFAGAEGQLNEAAGRDIAEGGFAFTPTCDAVEHTFQANVLSNNIPWHGGQARVRADLFVQLCDQFGNCQQVRASVDMQISIRG